MQFWARTLSLENVMDLAQILLEIFQSEHGHSDSDAKLGKKNKLFSDFL